MNVIDLFAAGFVALVALRREVKKTRRKQRVKVEKTERDWIL